MKAPDQRDESEEREFSDGSPHLVEQLLPTRQSKDLSEVLVRLNSAPTVTPFDPSRMEFIAEASRSLRRRGRGLPETQALAFWMRKSELSRMAESFLQLGTAETLLMPRGTVFHVPPSNVDTMFVYSWVFSMLVGNRNIVRLSSRGSEESRLIIDTIAEVMTGFPAVADANVMITYGHDDAITSRISAHCDVRVIWGGNATINRLRSIPIPPHATELVFADRFSMAAISISAYRSLAPEMRSRLAELFFADTYWFDQLGCSSARLLLWVGPEDPQGIASDFYERVRAVAHLKGYVVNTSDAIAKLAQSYRTIIDAKVTSYSAPDNLLTVLEMSSFPDVRGEFCGGGLFYQLHAADLNSIVSFIQRADQTLASFGIPEKELRTFIHNLNGRGIDRVVPFGQALRFSRYWDGYDLLAEFTRKTSIQFEDVLE